MGLDMYLTRRVYVGLNYEHNRVGANKVVIKGIEQEIDKLTDISFEAMYWRKMNSIHSWFVENIQDGNDDCKEYYVDHDDLDKLIQQCKEDITYLESLEEDKTKDSAYEGKLYKPDLDKLNLKTREGFFFGFTDYTDNYIERLKETVEVLEKELQKEGEFYYQSSW